MNLQREYGQLRVGRQNRTEHYCLRSCGVAMSSTLGLYGVGMREEKAGQIDRRSAGKTGLEEEANCKYCSL